MEHWQDQAIILSARAHGEHGAIVSLLSPGQGRVMGYVRGGQGSKMRGVLEIGNVVDAHWSARTAESLGSLKMELAASPASCFLNDAARLGALQAACALCDTAIPEKEGGEGLFYGFQALCAALQGAVWGQAYVMWEIALLKELGFALDLSRCAGGGDDRDLAYVSPRTGRAVSREMGAPYKDKLLKLPEFLRPGGGGAALDEHQEILMGLRLTGYFLEHWVYAHHTKGVPKARLLFQERL